MLRAAFFGPNQRNVVYSAGLAREKHFLFGRLATGPSLTGHSMVQAHWRQSATLPYTAVGGVQTKCSLNAS